MDISIDPDAVDGTARTLQQGATQVNDAGTSARTTLSDSAGLPPVFARRADALAGLVTTKCLGASDAIAIAGIELARRAEVARLVDSGSIGGGDAFKPATPAGARLDLRLWTQSTEDAARAHPGAYFADIAAALAKVAGGQPQVAPAVVRGPDTKRRPDPQRTPGRSAPAKEGKKVVDTLPSTANAFETGSTVTVAEAVKRADNSGTGIVIAVGSDGVLHITGAS